MAMPVILPRQGQSVESCLLLSWKKSEGDPVQRGDTLCEVETDKATFAVEAPEAGTLLKQYYREGQDVPVLSVIAVVGQPGETVAAGPAPSAATSEPEPAAARAPDAPGMDATEGRTEPRHPSRVGACSPRASRRAAELGIPLGSVRGTGPGGRIMERDVIRDSAVAERAPLPGPERTAPPDTRPGEVVPVRGIRKLIADRMLASLRNTAQLTINSSADARELESLRSRLKASPEAWGLSQITVTDIILFALSRLLVRHPEVNAHWLGDRFVQYTHVHLGLAVDTPRGLMVPSIRHAERLTLREISAEARRLAIACREGTVQPQDLGDSTFTLSNLGALGVETFTPVVNPPEVAILGVGNIQIKPVRVEDRIDMVPHLGLSLTVDHQAVDGAPAARFLAETAAVLSSPIRSLAL